MKNSTIDKLKSSPIVLITLFILLDGISALFIGFVYFFLTNYGDYTVLEPTVGVMMRQRGQFVVRIAFAYLLVCVISLFYWSWGKRYWATVLSSLGICHVVGLALIKVAMNDSFVDSVFTPAIFISLGLNLIMIYFVYRENVRVSSLQSQTG